MAAKGEHIRVSYRRQYDMFNPMPHFHNMHEIIFVLEGELDIAIGSETYAVDCPALVFISALENHTICLRTNNYHRYFLSFSDAYASLYIRQACLMSLFLVHPDKRKHVYPCTREEITRFQKLFETVYQEYNAAQPLWELRLSILLLELLVHLYREASDLFPVAQSGRRQQIVGEVQRYILGHLTEPLSLRDIAERFFLNAQYLCRIFKQVSGYNLKEFIILERVAKAKELLLRSEMSVAQICEVVGYNNANHFIKMFKRKEGVSPCQYRKRMGGKAKR